MWYIGYLNSFLGMYHEKPDGADWIYDNSSLLNIYDTLKNTSKHTTDVASRYPFANYVKTTGQQGFRYRAIACVKTDKELLYTIKNFATLYSELHI